MLGDAGGAESELVHLIEFVPLVHRGVYNKIDVSVESFDFESLKD